MSKEKKTRIAHVSAVFVRNGGGTGQACYQLVSKLNKMPDLEVEVFLPASQKQSSEIEKEVKINYIEPHFSFGNSALIPRLTNQLKGFDIIHLHYPFFGGAEYVQKASSKFDIPYIITFHTDTVFQSIVLTTILKIYNFIYQKKIISDATKVIGVTKSHLNSSSIANLANKAKKVFIPNGVADIFFTKQRFKQQINKNKACLTLGFCSVIDNAHYYKGLEILMEAIKDIDAKLLICGDGNLLSHYKKVSYGLGVNAKCHFLGALESEKLVDFYDSIDILVSPSTIAESFSIVNIESLSRGKPIITASWPATKEIAQSFPAGYYNLLTEITPKAIENKINEVASNLESFKPQEALVINVTRDQYNWGNISKKIVREYLNVH
ncbi:MAG: glycosyltransferase family 4 protein [Patescibacteria group bacterium]